MVAKYPKSPVVAKYPNRRPFNSCRPPDVAVMEPANTREPDHVANLRWLDRPRLGRVSRKTEVGIRVGCRSFKTPEPRPKCDRIVMSIGVVPPHVVGV